MRVTQWCFAAVSTVDPTFMCLDQSLRTSVRIVAAVGSKMSIIAGRWLSGLERRLEGRTWIACDDVTVADIMMAGVLRVVRKTDLLAPFPRIQAYYARCFARPAWERTLGMYAERF